MAAADPTTEAAAVEQQPPVEQQEPAATAVEQQPPAGQQEPAAVEATSEDEQQLVLLATQPLVDPSPTPPSVPLALKGPEEVEIFEPKAGQQKAQYSWKLWTMNYVPTKAAEEAASKVDESILESDRWRDHADQMQGRCEVAEGRLADAVLEVERAQSNAAWQAELLQTEHAARVQVLEELLVSERKAHEEQIANLEQMAHQERERCDARVKKAEAKAAETNQRLTLEAELAARDAAAAQKRAEQEVERARAREEKRVQEARDRCAEELKRTNEKKNEEVERLQAWVTDRAQMMEEACMRYLKEKKDTDQAAKSYVDAAESRMHQQREVEQTELKRRADRFDEWRGLKEAHYEGRPQPLEMKEKADAFWRHQAAARMDRNVVWATTVGAEEGGRSGFPNASPTRPARDGQLMLSNGFPKDGSF